MNQKSSDSTALPAPVAEQLAGLVITRGKPLLIVDADEVLFYFMRGLEGYLASKGLYFDWSSYALYGNIRRQADDVPLPAEDLHLLIERFFAEATEDLEPVDGAAAALASLEPQAQVVVLSNVPLSARAARLRALERHGMKYPLIANSGPKGPAAAWLQDRAAAPTSFVDDIPHNHASVANMAPAIYRLHYVADSRLSALLGPAAHCHHRAESWAELQTQITVHLGSG